MLHVGLDLSRCRVDVQVLDPDGVLLATTKASPDEAGLRALAERIGAGEPVRAAIESMTGARFVRDVLAGAGWEVLIADAAQTKRLAPLACKTDRIDAWVLAELSRRDLVPAIWLPPLRVREERERARFRLHLVKHRQMLKARIHSTLMTFGVPVKTADLFGVTGRAQLARLRLPEPWAGDVAASLLLIDTLDGHIGQCEQALRALGADHRYLPRLMSAPGIGWVLGYTIAAEIGDITRFRSPAKLVGYTGLCPRVYQSGQRDRRGPISKAGPRYLRWALIEAATHACAHPAYRDRYQRTRARLGPQRGTPVARVELARDLAHAIWHMLTHDQDFAPAGANSDLAA
ncbi:MAG TPA: IS110 family transposase [Actinomycetes bacterium]